MVKKRFTTINFRRVKAFPPEWIHFIQQKCNIYQTDSLFVKLTLFDPGPRKNFLFLLKFFFSPNFKLLFPKF